MNRFDLATLPLRRAQLAPALRRAVSLALIVTMLTPHAAGWAQGFGAPSAPGFAAPSSPPSAPPAMPGFGAPPSSPFGSAPAPSGFGNPAPAPVADPAEVRSPSERAFSVGRVLAQDSRQLLADLAEHLVRTQGFAVIGSSVSNEADDDSIAADRSRDAIDVERAQTGTITLVRAATGQRQLVSLTLSRPPRRLATLVVQGQAHPLGQPEQLTPLAQITDGSLVRSLRTALAERRRVTGALALGELDSRTIELSYVDADAAIFALRSMGFTAITDSEGVSTDTSFKGDDDTDRPAAPGSPPAQTGGQSGFGGSFGGSSFGGSAAGGSSFGSSSGSGFGGGFGSNASGSFGGSAGGAAAGSRMQALRNLPSSVNLDRLPLIIKLPAADLRTTGLVGAEVSAGGGGGSNLQRDSLGLTVVPSAANQLPETVAGPATQLLVLYHPSYPGQLERVRRAVNQVIDKPARQVYVEGLVIEISEAGLRELGVQWGASKDNRSIQLGAAQQLSPGDFTFTFGRDTTKFISPTEIKNRINAVVAKNQAEVLSRPSVITLDNRQATIRVGTDIPISTSRDTGTGSGGRVAFSFQYIPTGILLNVRPRISEDNSEISLQVDATVSATVPNQDLQVIDPTTKLVLASAPSISTRRVQTYARIRNSFPLIIGGLVSRSSTGQDEKVPGLGETPVLGKLFGREAKRGEKREVVIVLIPSIVTENFRETKAQYPKDDERFDLRGTDLMREHYRLRAEDLQDSQYIRTNRRFLAYREAANAAIKARPELASKAPFSLFQGDRVPGEFTFVTGMMYRTLQTLSAKESILSGRMFFFERAQDKTQRPVTMDEVLARYGDGSSPASFFERNPGKALSLTFRLARQSTDPGDMFAEPVPEIALIPCANRMEWSRLLWQLNQPSSGVSRFTVLIHDPSDLDRLRVAFATKNTVLNNGLERAMVFNNWLPGKLVHLQEASPNWSRLLEATVARYFFIGEHAYSSFIAQHEAAMSDLAAALKAEDIAPLVKHITLP